MLPCGTANARRQHRAPCLAALVVTAAAAWSAESLGQPFEEFASSTLPCVPNTAGARGLKIIVFNLA